MNIIMKMSVIKDNHKNNYDKEDNHGNNYNHDYDNHSGRYVVPKNNNNEDNHDNDDSACVVGHFSGIPSQAEELKAPEQ